MKLTRKFLATLGIEEEKADEIINVHAETVNSLKDELEAAQSEASKLPTVLKELDELKAAAADAEKGENPFEVKYNALKEEFASFKKETEAAAARAKKEQLFKALLRDVGVAEKRIDAVVKVSDLDGIKLDKEGKIEDAAAVKKQVAKEWEDFVVTEKTVGAETAKPPASTGGSTYASKSEIMAIHDPETRQKAIADNIQLFTSKGAE